LLSRAVWDDQEMLDIAAAWAVSHLDDGDAVLIVDETADEKSSADAAGAARGAPHAEGTRRAHAHQNRCELTRSTENRNCRSAAVFERLAGSRTAKSSSPTTGETARLGAASWKKSLHIRKANTISRDCP